MTSPEYVKVMLYEELKEREIRTVEVDGLDVLLTKVDGRVFAIRNVCTHGGVPLSGGKVKGLVIECYAHRALFDLRTGKASYPAKRRLFTYETMIDGPWIAIKRVSMDEVFPLEKLKSRRS